MSGAGAQDVVLRVGGSPENVRTARLVAAAVARREGLPEDRVDEVRIAVGEAVTWAMHTRGRPRRRAGAGPRRGRDGHVRRPRRGRPVAHARRRTASIGSGSDGLALALLRGLADRVVITGETTVLTWSDAP